MDREEFVLNKSVELLKELPDNAEPSWGRMSAQNMVEHLGILFMISGKRINPQGLPKQKQKRYYEQLKSGSFSFKPNTKSPVLPEDPLPHRFDSIEEAKSAAIKGLEHFSSHFKENSEDKVEHPVFGPLSYEEWLHFHSLHLKHHFTQFGLISK